MIDDMIDDIIDETIDDMIIIDYGMCIMMITSPRLYLNPAQLIFC